MTHVLSKKLLTLLFVTGTLFLQQSFLQAKSTGALTGIITDQVSGNPLTDVLIEVRQGKYLIASTLTSPTGEYSIQNLNSPETYTIIARCAKYQTATKPSIPISDKEKTNVNFALESKSILTGTVINAANNTPLADVDIKVINNSTIIGYATTAADGTYTIDNLDAGNYSIQAKTAKFKPSITSISLDINQTKKVNIALLAIPGMLEGRVTDSTSGEPVANSTIELWKGDSRISETKTNVHGRYCFNEVAPDSYTLHTQAPGFQHYQLPVSISSSEFSIASPTLFSNPGTISGTVLKASTSQPIDNICIDISKDGTLISSTTTGNNGAFIFPQLAPGTGYSLSTRATEYQSIAETGISVSAAKTTSIVMKLAPKPGILEGKILDSNQVPIAEAIVDVLQGSTTIESVTTSAEGTFTIPSLLPGSYIMRACAEKFQTTILSTTVTPNAATNVTILLKNEPRSVSGCVLDSQTKRGIEEATVDALQGEIVIGSTMTDENGNYTISGLTSEKYVIRATASHYQTCFTLTTVEQNATVGCNLHLPSNPEYIEGTIFNAITHTPIAKATVDVMQDNVIVSSMTTEDNGRYTFAHLAQGNYTIRVQAQEFQTALAPVTIVANKIVTQNFDLTVSPGSIIGNVFDKNSKETCASASISVYLGNNIIGTTRTGIDGSYTLTGLSSEEYSIKIQGTGYRPFTTSARVSSSDSTTINVPLIKNPGMIAGNVFDATTQEKLIGVSIDILSGSHVIRSTSTDSSGNFSFENITPGSYTVRATSKNKYQIGSLPITVITEKTTTAPIGLLQLLNRSSSPSSELSSTATEVQSPLENSISVLIRSAATKRRIAKVHVQVMRNEEIIASSYTDEKGMCSIAHLTPGTYKLRVTKGKLYHHVSTTVTVETKKQQTISLLLHSTTSASENYPKTRSKHQKKHQAKKHIKKK